MIISWGLLRDYEPSDGTFSSTSDISDIISEITPPPHLGAITLQHDPHRLAHTHTQLLAT